MAKHIAFFVSSFNLGGVERAFITLANSFAEDGHKVDFIVSMNEGILKDELNSNVTIIDLGCHKLRDSFTKLYGYIKRNSLDLLITGPTYPNIIAVICNLVAFNKLKVVVTQHSYQDVEMDNLGLIGKIAPYLIKRTYNYSHKVVCVSSGVAEDMINNYNIKSTKISIIYNAVIDSLFISKSKENIDENTAKQIPNKNYLIAVGRLAVVKNYSFMIKAFAKMKKENPNFIYDLIILGEGEEKQNLKQLTVKLGVQNSVHLLGAFSNPLPIMKQAKLFIHSSFSEAMPLVYIEALALKVPVLTVINKGAIEILEDIIPKRVINSHNEELFIEGILEMINENYESKFPTLEKYKSEIIREEFLKII